MNELKLRTMVVVAILLATLIVVGYLVAHNVSMTSHCTSLLLTVGVVARLVLETKVRLKQPLPPLPSWEETKATLEHPPSVAKHVLLYFLSIFAFILLNHFVNKLSPVGGVAIEAVLAVLVAGGCVADVRAIGRRHLPAKYVWMLTTCSLLLSIGIIFMCGETIRSGIMSPHSGH